MRQQYYLRQRKHGGCFHNASMKALCYAKRKRIIHSWRHLLAKNLVENGVNKAIGMKILGHKTSHIFDLYIWTEESKN
jgi:integrase